MILIGNGNSLTFDPALPFIENGAVAVEGDTIVKVGRTDELFAKFPGAEFIDARGGIIMPGMINAHTHFYASLLRGASIPGPSPSSLIEALKRKSWKEDRLLTFTDCVFAAYAGMIECIRMGVTTVFDHHACSGEARGTLLGLAGAVKKAGLRACLSLETSLRCGFEVCSAQIAENDEFISLCEKEDCGRVAAMFGLHAPFTLSDRDIACCAERANGRTGFHVHLSEGMDDNYVSWHNYGVSPAFRLSRYGILGNKTLLAHCVHISEDEMRLIADSGSFVVNAPQSNLSNAVGTAPVSSMLEKGIPVCLGTDSFTYDMLESARAFVLAQRSANGAPSGFEKEAAELLFVNNAKLASLCFKREFGLLKAGAAADIVILDHRPMTRMDENNAVSHLIFGASGRDCVMTMAAGRVLMRDRKLLTLDEDALRSSISTAADALWERMQTAPEYVYNPTFDLFGLGKS